MKTADILKKTALWTKSRLGSKYFGQGKRDSDLERKVVEEAWSLGEEAAPAQRCLQGVKGTLGIQMHEAGKLEKKGGSRMRVTVCRGLLQHNERAFREAKLHPNIMGNIKLRTVLFTTIRGASKYGTNSTRTGNRISQNLEGRKDERSGSFLFSGRRLWEERSCEIGCESSGHEN